MRMPADCVGSKGIQLQVIDRSLFSHRVQTTAPEKSLDG